MSVVPRPEIRIVCGFIHLYELFGLTFSLFFPRPLTSFSSAGHLTREERKRCAFPSCGALMRPDTRTDAGGLGHGRGVAGRTSSHQTQTQIQMSPRFLFKGTVILAKEPRLRIRRLMLADCCRRLVSLGGRSLRPWEKPGRERMFVHGVIYT